MKKFLALLLVMLLILSLAACGKEEQQTEEQPVAADAEAADPAAAETADPADAAEETEQVPADLEGVDLSTFSFGVVEDGDNVLVTVKNDTELGEVACVMAYMYEEDKLAAAYADYYVPDEESAAALAEQIKSDDSIVAESVAVNGTCVSCQIADDQLTELREITREELIQVMEYTISSTQEQ